MKQWYALMSYYVVMLLWNKKTKIIDIDIDRNFERYAVVLSWGERHFAQHTGGDMHG